MASDARERLDAWFAALERRYTRDLTFRELRRGLQALSNVYVERRHAIPRGAALDGAGKRAAFATFYGPLHFVVTSHVVLGLGACAPPPKRILDLGCGSGAGGAAWALGISPRPDVLAVDLHPWAVQEARRTFEHFGLAATVRRQRLERMSAPPDRAAVLLAFTVNELTDEDRSPLLDRLLAAASRGCRALVIEPIARRPVGWWERWERPFLEAGGRSDRWSFEAWLPAGWRRLDRAAGLDHSRLTARSLYLPGKPRGCARVRRW